jgi:hypothetical protein
VRDGVEQSARRLFAPSHGLRIDGLPPQVKHTPVSSGTRIDLSRVSDRVRHDPGTTGRNEVLEPPGPERAVLHHR